MNDYHEQNRASAVLAKIGGGSADADFARGPAIRSESHQSPENIMRPITLHEINPCNQSIRLAALDGFGSGGASHVYHVDTVPPGDKSGAEVAHGAYRNYRLDGEHGARFVDYVSTFDLLDEVSAQAWNQAALAIVKGCQRHPTIVFQNGPVKENGEGVNGLTHEVLLAILIDRLEGFQSGPYACSENALALGYLRAAMAAMHARTHAREARGVEGTHAV